MNTVTHLKTRVQRWAEAITEAHGNTVQAIIEVGRQLIQAKADCSHGEWGELTGRTNGKPLLPFSHQTARRLKSIACNHALSNGAHGRHLPASWRTLAVLASLDPDDIEAAISDRVIHPEMQRSDAEALKRALTEPPTPPAPTQEQVPPREPAPVIPLVQPSISQEERDAISEGLKEGGRLIADFAERQEQNARTSATLQAQFPTDPRTDAAEALGREVLAKLRALDEQINHADPKPQFNEHWQTAIGFADNIRKQLEQLT